MVCLVLDTERRAIISEVEKLKNLRNTVSNEISTMKKDKLDATEKIASMKDVSDSIKSMDERFTRN